MKQFIAFIGNIPFLTSLVWKKYFHTHIYMFQRREKGRGMLVKCSRCSHEKWVK